VGSGDKGGEAGKPGPASVAPAPPANPLPRPAPAESHDPRPGDRQEPALDRDAAPDYPESAREDGVSGSVTLSYTVNGEGRVEDARVVKSSGDSRLDQAALEAAKKWRYKPAVREGQPHPVKWRRTLRFNLQ
jgi:protein TonB